MIHAVIFDMDGLLLDSEVYWARARTEYCREHGCEWREEDEDSVKGHNSPEWATVLIARCSLEVPPPQLIEEIECRMRALYDEYLPLLPGAVSTVRALAEQYPLGIASSSPPGLIDFAMRKAEIRDKFRVVVSADTVGRGKPAPDVFLVAARELGHAPDQIAIFEDSTTGITAARAANAFVIAVPNPHNPPTPNALLQADLVLSSLEELHPRMLVR